MVPMRFQTSLCGAFDMLLRIVHKQRAFRRNAMAFADGKEGRGIGFAHTEFVAVVNPFER